MNANLNSIMQELSNYTQNYPIDQIVGELTIVVERLGFAKFDPEQTKDNDAVRAQLIYLLERDVSPGIMTFVNYLANTNMLKVLLDDEGQMFAGYCQTFFSAKKHIVFKSAVELTPEKQRYFSVSLMQIYPVSSRIVFEVDPSVVGGFVLFDGGTQVCDYSLRNKMVKLIEQRIKEKSPSPWNQTAPQS